MSELVTPLEWTPELYGRRREGELWCIVRWAVSSEGELYLCGPLEMTYPTVSADTYRGVGSLGFASCGFLALFPSEVAVNRFLDQDEPGRIGPGICQNHGLPLGALRFDVVTLNIHDSSSHVWRENVPYFEAMTIFAEAKLFARGARHKTVTMDLASCIEREWTLDELRAALRISKLGSKQALLGHRAGAPWEDSGA